MMCLHNTSVIFFDSSLIDLLVGLAPIFVLLGHLVFHRGGYDSSGSDSSGGGSGGSGGGGDDLWKWILLIICWGITTWLLYQLSEWVKVPENKFALMSWWDPTWSCQLLPNGDIECIKLDGIPVRPSMGDCHHANGFFVPEGVERTKAPYNKVIYKADGTVQWFLEKFTRKDD